MREFMTTFVMVLTSFVMLMLVFTFTVVVLINRIPGFGGVRLRNN